MPFGFKGVFTAVATGGVIFAYLGFEQAIQLGGESKNPRRNIPLAVIGSMLLGVVLYILLQIAFLGALSRATSRTAGQRRVPGNGGRTARSPVSRPALGLGWLATLLYIDAVVSPGGTGLLYVGTSSRVAFALGAQPLHPARRSSWLNSADGARLRRSLLASPCGMILFLPFPGWQKLVGFITSATVLAYALAPLAARRAAGRTRTASGRSGCRWRGRSRRSAFVVANLIVFWAGWTVDWRLFVAVAIGFVILAAAQRTMPKDERLTRLDLRAAAWLPPYIGGMALISYLGQYDGRGSIPFWWDVALVAVFSAGIYALALSLRLDPESAKHYMRSLAEEDEREEEELGTAPA